jgi:hypothetical protein
MCLKRNISNSKYWLHILGLSLNWLSWGFYLIICGILWLYSISYNDLNIFEGYLLTGETIPMTNVPTGYPDKYMFLIVFAGLFLINLIFTIILIREYYVIPRNSQTKRSSRRNINSLILLIVLFTNSYGLTQYTQHQGMSRIFAGENINKAKSGLQNLLKSGRDATIDQLGELVVSSGEAQEYTEKLLRLSRVLDNT